MIDIEEFFKEQINIQNEVDQESSEEYYKKYFEGTKNLKNNFNDPEMKIINGCRKFKSNINNSGYDEIFLNEKQKIFACISPQISLLYPPDNRIVGNRIGFRYYKYNPFETNNENPFFTLLITHKKKFIILEKNSTIKDINEKDFINPDLDCIDIICNIIKNKYINKKNHFNIIYPYSLVEILGFCYAAKEKKLQKFEILEPYFPDEFDPKTKTENFNINLKKIYIEPLLCNKHVSLLIFKYDNNFCRTNFIIDFSSFHYDNLIKFDPIFKFEMYSCLFKFPEKKIQFGPSSSIWFISTLLNLIECENFKFENQKFLINVIKKIENLMNLKEDETIINYDKIQNRENENISKNYFISNNIVFNCFIEVEGLLSIFYNNKKLDLIDNLKFYQAKFYEIRRKIDNLTLNSIYYKMISDKIIIDENKIKNLETKYYKAQDIFMDLFKDSREIMDKQPKYTTEYFKLKDEFKIKEKKLKEIFEEILNNNSKSFIEFTREQFFNKFIDSNDIFLEPFDK